MATQTAEHILIDCPICNIRVRADIEGDVHYVDDVDSIEFRITLVRCPDCRFPLVGRQQELDDIGPGGFPRRAWTPTKRLWPQPKLDISNSVPQKIARNLDEAQICLNSGAYTASVAMTGRALEAIGRHFHTKGKADKLMLAQGLEELYKEGIIDKRLHEWGQELRDNRNLAAHASDREFNRIDAQDLYDFAIAICQYVFVLTEKFEQFKARRDAKKPTPAKFAQ